MVPESALLNHPLVRGHASHEWNDDDLEGIGRLFKASKEVVLRRLLHFGRTSETYYGERRRQWEIGHVDMPDYKPRVTWSRRAFNRNGVAFTSLVLEAARDRIISSHEAADYLETKQGYLSTIESYLADRMSMR